MLGLVIYVIDYTSLNSTIMIGLGQKYPVSKMLAGWQQIGSKFDQNPTPEP